MKSVAASLITEYLKEISDIKALAGQVIVTGRSAILFIASGSEKSIFIVAESGWLQWKTAFLVLNTPVLKQGYFDTAFLHRNLLTITGNAV
jgi:hypothetical protein